jgi:hypothetical protein
MKDNFILFIYFYFIVMLGGSTLWHLQKFLQYIKYISLESTLSNIFLYPLVPPFLE